jgi:Flp pilus assembly protein TadB
MNPGELFTQGGATALLAGAALGIGLALFVAGLVGWPSKPKDIDLEARARNLRRLARRLTIALIVGVLVGLLSRWPVLGIGAVVLVMFWDKLFGGAASEKLAVRQIEALAMWTESLRDTIAGAVGLEQAIPASARGADPVLREHLNSLLDRLRGRMPLAEALQYLADDLDDPSADLVIAALMLNSKLRGPGLREVLTALSSSAREEVDMRQRVIAQRAGTRRSVQIIISFVIVFVLGVAVFNRNFVQPYGTPAGEAVLAVVLGLFGLGFVWLRKLAKVETPGRFLIRSKPVPDYAPPAAPGIEPSAQRVGGTQ